MANTASVFKPVLVFVLLVASLTSCKKVEDLEKSTPAEPISSVYPIEGFQSNDGVLVALRETEFYPTDSGEYKLESDAVYAYFYSKGSQAPFLDGGKVKIDSVELNRGASGVYEVPFPAYPFGYSFGDAVTWSVTGNPKNGVDPINVTLAGFTSQPILDTNIFSIEQGKPFNLKMLGTLQNTDTTSYVVFTIRQGNKTASHRLNSSSVQYLFPLAEVNGFSKGEAMIEIAAYRVKLLSPGSKRYYVLNGTLSYRYVEII